MEDKPQVKFGRRKISLSDIAALPEDRNASGNLMYKFEWLKDKGGEKTTGKEIADFLIENDMVSMDEKIILNRLLHQYFSYYAFFSEFEKDFDKWDRKKNKDKYPKEPVDWDGWFRFIGGGVFFIIIGIFVWSCEPTKSPNPCEKLGLQYNSWRDECY